MANDKFDKILKIMLFAIIIMGSLFFAREFLIPVSVSALFAILVMPVSEKLERLKVSRGLASLGGLLTIMIIFSIIIFVMTSQITSFVNDLPQLEENLSEKIVELKIIVEDLTGIPRETQKEHINRSINTIAGSVGLYVTQFLSFTADAAVFLLLISFYTFFFIHYRKKFHKFFLKIMPRSVHSRAKVVMSQTSGTINRYLLGVIGVVSILTVLNTIGLLMIGIQHAFFLGFLAGLLNIIPFIGSFTGSVIPVIIALATKDTIFPAVAVAALFTFNQTVESYLLTPNITGSQVRINPLMTLMALIVGSLLWGIAGMILFIPFTGILKVIIDHIPELKPIAYLISDEE